MRAKVSSCILLNGKWSLKVVLLTYMLITSSCFSQSSSSNLPLVSLQFVNQDGLRSPKLELEVVASPATRSFGLMYRKSLKQEAGMLFVFPDEGMRSFWMKNTYVPLDIIYLNSDKRIVTIVEQARPTSLQSYKSDKKAQYVVEIGAGLAKKWNLSNGSYAEFTIPREIEIH